MASDGIRAVPFSPDDAGRWDGFVRESLQGTMLHSRKFLSYHGERFRDCSLLFLDGEQRLRGVLPAAQSAEDAGVVVSHPGATYGGMLVGRANHGLDAIACLHAAREHYAASGYTRLLYRAVPLHLHRKPDQVDLYALWRIGARLVRRDLWNVVDVTAQDAARQDRGKRLRRPPEGGLQVVRDGSESSYRSFHAMLCESLVERHAVAPVHSLAEMVDLQQRFPDEISLWRAVDGQGECLAGVWTFDLGAVRHGQYGASSALGRRFTAQDLVLKTCIADCAAAGARYFSFGTSTENHGSVLNEGLFAYKFRFGAGAVVQDFYELDLRS